MKPQNNRYCRRHLLAFCISLFSIQFALAGNNGGITCSLKENIPTGKLSIDKELNSFISPPFVYYFSHEDWNPVTRSLKIYSTNSISAEKDSFIINIPESVPINYLPSIALNSEYLILTDDEQLSTYRFKKTNGVYMFTNKIKLPPHSNGGKALFLTNKIALLHSIYNHHPEDKTFNSNLGIYDVEKNTVLKFIHPDLPCIGFSHLINSWITASDKLIALAHPCGYKVIFYDFSLNPKDSINYSPEADWKDLPGNKIPIETNPAVINPKLLIDKLLIMQDTISRIEKIFFINDSTLFVSSLCKHCGTFKRRIDVFKTNNFKKPFLTDTEFKIEYTEEDSIIMSNEPLHLYYPSNLLIKNNILYTINGEDFQLNQNISVKEFNHLKDIYYEKNDPHFSINIYNIDLP